MSLDDVRNDLPRGNEALLGTRGLGAELYSSPVRALFTTTNRAK